jgi:hypothetical protein
MEKPLFDMKDRAAETADQMERVAKATRAAAFDAESFGQALRDAQVDRLAGVDGFNPLGGPPESGEMGVNPKDRKFPWQGAGPSGPQGGATGDGGGGGGNRGGGSSRAAAPQSNLDRLRDAAKTDPRARAELMRLENEQSQQMSRASDLRARGFFNSAASVEIRAEQRSAARADQIAALELATSQFGGSNMGEAFRGFREDMQRGNMMTGMSQQEFEKFYKDQVKTEKERERQEEMGARGSGRAGAAGKDPMTTLAADIGEIKNVLTRTDGILDRLPVRSLAA